MAKIKYVIEALLLNEYKTVPFHNLFMLNGLVPKPSIQGGTCSDKVLHFKAVLARHGIHARLHQGSINGVECHRLLSVEVCGQKYWIEVGNGWPCLQLLPVFKPVEYTVYGMTFKTVLEQEHLILQHRTQGDFSSMITIPHQEKPESVIEQAIKDRFMEPLIYPFRSQRRFSMIKGDSFYFIKGERLRIYHDSGVTEHVLTPLEVYQWIHDFFEFDLSPFQIY
jgi:asparagine synthase (glutamine-hydrolysing)